MDKYNRNAIDRGKREMDEEVREAKQSRRLQAAFFYADLGFPVFPCVPGAKSPLTKHGFHDASTDHGQIEKWWAENPEANVAIPTQGLAVIDIDTAENTWPDNRELEDQLSRRSCPISLTPRGGRHLIFRQPGGKNWKNSTSRLAPKVDTRANGGYILVPPSTVNGKHYRWADTLELDCPPDQLPEPPVWLSDVLDGLISHQLPQIPQGLQDGGENDIPEHYRNPTLSSLAGSMRRRGMGRSEILAALTATNTLRCKPPLDQEEVSKIARSVARYAPDLMAVAGAENHWEQMFGGDAAPPSPSTNIDPGTLPPSLLSIPGFINEVMEYTLKTAPYPNPTMAFAGALCLQAFLASRKVRDQGDNRPNIYILGLAFSAAGKDWPRKVNTRVLHEIGMADRLGDRFASGEGLQDSLFLSPAMLFQGDEWDGLLRSVNGAKDSRHESIMGTLLTLYSASNSVYPMRRKAGDEEGRVIDQPALTIFGTAIPTHYYEALSERMLTNGFFARMIILENAKRGTGQEPTICDLPPNVIKTAQWWKDFRPGTGNFEEWEPIPKVVPRDKDAEEVLIASRIHAEQEYILAQDSGDAVGTTVWGRVSEQIRKLALLYAISENHIDPVITKAGATWATSFMLHQTRRMLFMADSHVADNEFHSLCLKATKKIRDAKDGRLSHSVLLKRMKMDSKAFAGLIATLVQQGDIETVQEKTGGRPSLVYQIRGGAA